MLKKKLILLFLLTILVAPNRGVAQINNDSPYPGTKFGGDYIFDDIVSGSVKRLQKLGYSDSVINTLINNRIDILVEMANLSDAQLKPVTLYRGIAATPKNYDPLYLRRVHLNSFWRCLALRLSGAMGWAGSVDAGQKGTERVVLEFQYPSYMLFILGTHVGDDETRVDTHKLPDDRIFLNRLGTFRIGETSTQVKWYSYEDVFAKDGSFKLPPSH